MLVVSVNYRADMFKKEGRKSLFIQMNFHCRLLERQTVFIKM